MNLERKKSNNYKTVCAGKLIRYKDVICMTRTAKDRRRENYEGIKFLI